MSLSLMVSLCFGSVGWAAKLPPPFGDSLEWNTGRESPGLDALTGKSVLVVFFQSWCPICNGWSGEFFKQMTETYGDDPGVVLMAIKTDGGSMREAVGYIEERADVEKWMVAVDKGGAYLQQALGRDKLYEYMWVGPDGRIGGEGEAGRYRTGSDPKEFMLARPDQAKNFRKGTGRLIPADKELDDALGKAVTLAEKGLFTNALGEAAKATSPGLEEDVATLREIIATRMDAVVATHKANLEGRKIRGQVSIVSVLATNR